MITDTKHFGYTTCNGQGLFEVRWEIDSFWRKLFGMKTTFKFVNHTMHKANYKTVKLSHQQWFDEQDNLVTNKSTIDDVNSVILETIYL